MMAQTISGLKLVLSDPQGFYDAISGVGRLVDEVTFKATPTTLGITAMDPANVAMVVFKMESRAFLTYNVAEDTSFSIKLGSLKQVLSRREKDGILSLEIDNNQLRVSLSGKTKKEYVLPLLDLEDKAQKMPDLKFNVEITMENSELKEAVADVAIVGEACEFRVANDKFVISAAGDQSKAISETKSIIKVLGEDKTAKAKYSIEYLDKMLAGKFKNAKVFLGKDYPMKLSYTSETGTVTMDFLLAPRIDNE